jgi:hypothetical protein
MAVRVEGLASAARPTLPSRSLRPRSLRGPEWRDPLIVGCVEQSASSWHVMAPITSESRPPHAEVTRRERKHQ